MAEAMRPRRLVRGRDGVRIVPLHRPEGLAPSARPPLLTYRAGPLLTSVQVFTVFWGKAWQGPQAPLAQTLNGFFDYVLSSALVDQLGEYSVPGKTIGHGQRTGTTTVTQPAPGHAIGDASIRRWLQSQIASSPAFPKPGPNTLYFLYLPPGVAVSQGGGRSCFTFCGYHDAINAQVFYAVMPFAGCQGCLGGLSAKDALTSTSSHELCEAITDPVPAAGWYDDANGEIGDICAWKTKQIGGFTVQLEWSNRANACV